MVPREDDSAEDAALGAAVRWVLCPGEAETGMVREHGEAAGKGTAVRYVIPTECTTCHRDVHNGQLGTRCADCHKLDRVARLAPARDALGGRDAR